MAASFLQVRQPEGAPLSRPEEAATNYTMIHKREFLIAIVAAAADVELEGLIVRQAILASTASGERQVLGSRRAVPYVRCKGALLTDW